MKISHSRWLSIRQLNSLCVALNINANLCCHCRNGQLLPGNYASRVRRKLIALGVEVKQIELWLIAI